MPETVVEMFDLPETLESSFVDIRDIGKAVPKGGRFHHSER